jgi:hypothetical protein
LHRERELQKWINFGVLVSNTFSWMLAFSHPNWNLAKGQKFPIVLSFDGRNTFNVDGVVASNSVVMVPMPDNSALIKSFRAAHTMSAFAQGNLFQFDLKMHFDSSAFVGQLCEDDQRKRTCRCDEFHSRHQRCT